MNITKKWKKFVVGFDPHGACQDKAANDAFFKFVKHWNPEIRIAGGDVFDFGALRGKASEHERSISLKDDLSMGMEWLEKLRPQVYLLGNHEQFRLWKLAKESVNAFVKDAAQEGVASIENHCRKLKCAIRPYTKREGFYALTPELWIVHGFKHGMNAPRDTALAYGKSILMGHIHRIQHNSLPTMNGGIAWCCGCLADLEMDYVSSKQDTFQWAHGWAFGVVNESTGSFEVWQAKKAPCGAWLLPTGVEQL